MKHLKKFLCLVLSIILVLSLSACDSSDYKKAMELYESGDLDGAITAFSVLGDYEDSADMVLKIKYEKAEGLFSGGYYEDAKVIYEELGDYNNSVARIEMCDKELENIALNKAIDDVVTLFESDVDKAKVEMHNLLNSELEDAMLNPYAAKFREKAEVCLEDNSKVAYAIVGELVKWAEQSGNNGYNVTSLSGKFSLLKWRNYKPGDVVKLGKCKQGMNSNYTSAITEQIEWIVVDNTGDKLLLLSKMGLYNGSLKDLLPRFQGTFFDSENDFIMSKIGSAENLFEFTVADYEKYKSVDGVMSCCPTLWAFMLSPNNESGERHQSDIDSVRNKTANCIWRLSDSEKGVNCQTDMLVEASEQYCRIAVWIDISC